MRGNDLASLTARQADHEARLRAELVRVVELLRSHPGVRQVILFGSLSRGQPHPRSDLDLAIIQDTDKPFMDRLDELYRLLLPRVPTDLLVYTPREWHALVNARSFVRRIEREGRVLYDAVAA